MGFRDRERLLPEAAREVIHPRGRLEGPSPVPWLVVDGAVDGSWSRRRDGRRATVDIRPLHALGRTAGTRTHGARTIPRGRLTESGKKPHVPLVT